MTDAPSRRQFLGTSAAGAASLLLPTYIPRTWLFGGGTPPSRAITVAQVGCGRMGMEDLRGTIVHDLCRVVAVCDLDATRRTAAQAEVEQFYRARGEQRVAVQAYHDFHEVLARPDIDAVIITPPDHWHALLATHALLAGKDVYVQKPVTYDIEESVSLRATVRRTGRILQTGSQQRSSTPWQTFRIASEAVRNGRIGTLRTIRIGIGRDEPKGRPPVPQQVPAGFDYDTWLGPAPEQPYMEDRVHPQSGYGRPGWITTEDFGLGMITNWGAHHIDIAQWAMGMELSGPTRVSARADFMRRDVWTVHHGYHIEMEYATGATVILDDRYTNGLRFEGSDGWVFCARGDVPVTASDPRAATPDGAKALDASDPRLLTEPHPAGAVRWAPSDNHYRNWLEAIAARRDPVAPIEQSVRSLQACATAWISMKLGRPVVWDPRDESFPGDAAANALRRRQPRAPQYDAIRLALTK
ncbi:MAG: Gfo/Idh/MocA family oxidoreductase [Gemmatimonadaceae bacterium]|nr:Gfo/Idh/MocA family oxidoreductase [Gemmatimonadaceae bacterium]